MVWGMVVGVGLVVGAPGEAGFGVLGVLGVGATALAEGATTTADGGADRGDERGREPVGPTTGAGEVGGEPSLMVGLVAPT